MYIFEKSALRRSLIRLVQVGTVYIYEKYIHTDCMYVYDDDVDVCGPALHQLNRRLL